MTKLIFIATSLIVGCTFFLGLSIFFGANPLISTSGPKNYALSILPQGWAFFTKSSKDPLIYMFKKNNNSLEEINLRGTSGEFYYGLSRQNKVLNVEISNILQQLNYSTTTPHEYQAPDIKSLVTKLENDTSRFEDITISKQNAPDINGDVTLVIQNLLPWYMLHKKPNYNSDFIAYKLNVQYK